LVEANLDEPVKDRPNHEGVCKNGFVSVSVSDGGEDMFAFNEIACGIGKPISYCI